MEEFKKQIDIVFNGFFYNFGFMKNPAEEKAKAILKRSPAEKMKADLKRINKSYREKYNKMRKEILSLEY